MKREIDKNNTNVIETLIDCLLILFDFTTDKIADYIKKKDLEKRLKL